MRVCGNCQSDVVDASPTCPRCGAELPKGFFGGLLEAVFGKRRTPAPTGTTAPASPARADDSPSRPAGEAFEFEVEDVFTITGRGTVATGRVTKGRIAVGDEVSFRTTKGDVIRNRIGAIEAFRKTVKEASEGETVGLLLAKSVAKDALVRGVRIERA